MCPSLFKNSTLSTIESKFIGDAKIASMANEFLEHVCIPDPNYPKGKVCSIYFDTPSLYSWKEKLNGDFIKSKLRLRWYEVEEAIHRNSMEAFLELKLKEGTGRKKIRKKIFLKRGFFDSLLLESPLLKDLILEHLKDFPDYFNINIFPVISISYIRYRFICPISGARVCLDKEISCDQINSSIFPSLSYIDVKDIVIEIKDKAYIGYLPWIERLYKMGFRISSFSKYGLIMTLAMEGIIL